MPPTAKEIKYDRQLRLWSANGQSALESSHLLLINAAATGTEILKNLVLPGYPPLSVYFRLLSYITADNGSLPWLRVCAFWLTFRDRCIYDS
jgi:hypothetical protein